ncbi:unnamed protein product [Peronospora belbahrii]|uniref:WHIM1 domain-containing protein n=1 Tax=Peronospora belbahrii TaxID=622444 RepID=A0AAU9L2B1_9STRA|nr:unnamed protein product [Peronospora belbahrii]CAH0522264.1 unnamed protein product [Peronospora belbahrii]
MARYNTLKRISSRSFESDGAKGSKKKLKTLRNTVKDVEDVIRRESLDADDHRLNSMTRGEDDQTSILLTRNHVNCDKEDIERDEEMANVEAVGDHEVTECNGKSKINASVKLMEKKAVKKRLQSAVVSAANLQTHGKTKTTVKTKPGGRSQTPAVSKRNVRTQDDKMKENAPLALPFFVETGAEWNNTNIDFDELNTLRLQWELPAACHILWLLQGPLTLRFSNKLLEYEAALLKPEDSSVLEDVFTKLLLKKSERASLTAGFGLKYEWWNKQLRIYYLDMYDKWYALLRKAGERLPDTFSQDEDDDTSSVLDNNSDEQVDVELTDDEWLTLDILRSRLETLGMVCPLKHQSFADLSIELRCKILLNLCEAVVDDPINTEYMRQMEDDDLRIEPLGNDRAGNLYYFFPQFYEERRLYRLDKETQQWALWAKGDDAFRSMFAAMKKICGRRIRGEQELLDHLEVILEQIEDEDEARTRELEKANRLAILKAVPRKRSLRLQVKQLVKMERQQEEQEQQKELTMEEIAEMKRAELLRKVEREAEKDVRNAKREARRLHREQIEREEAQSERERRRLRRIEKEVEEEKGELLTQNGRKKQGEARELRARQRHIDDEWQEVIHDEESTGIETLVSERLEA